MNDTVNEIKRWTAKRKVQVVMDILRCKTTVVARQHDLPPAEVEGWLEEGAPVSMVQLCRWFGHLGRVPAFQVLRSNNGLVFSSKRFTNTVRAYRLA